MSEVGLQHACAAFRGYKYIVGHTGPEDTTWQ